MSEELETGVRAVLWFEMDKPFGMEAFYPFAVFGYPIINKIQSEYGASKDEIEANFIRIYQNGKAGIVYDAQDSGVTHSLLKWRDKKIYKVFLFLEQAPVGFSLPSIHNLKAWIDSRMPHEVNRVIIEDAVITGFSSSATVAGKKAFSLMLQGRKHPPVVTPI